MKFILALFLFCTIDVVHAQNLTEQILGQNQKGVNTDVVLVKRNDQLIVDSYVRDYLPTTPHLSWSMAKTITGILLAQASLEYKFSFSDPVKKFIPEFKGDARIIDIIQMSSGIDFTEQYFGLPVSSDVVRMLYLDGAEKGATEYVKSLPLREKFKAGDHFYYSSGDANLLMEILKKVINNDQKYENYPWSKFFDPLEIKKATFERDRNDIFIGSSYIYMTAPDYLKVGELIMNNGKYKNIQIIPEFYIELLHTLAPGVSQTALDGTSSARAYSAQATTNLPITARKMNSEHPDLPTDSILLLGHQGQLIVASPKEKLVIVRLACDKGTSFKRNTFFAVIKDLIKKNQTDYKTAVDEKAYKESEAVPAQSLINTKLNILDLFKVPRLIRNYTAKEYCSCLFVMGRKSADCEKDIALTMPVMPQIKISGDNKVVTNFFIGDTAQAEYVSEKFGCRLVE